MIALGSCSGVIDLKGNIVGTSDFSQAKNQARPVSADAAPELAEAAVNDTTGASSTSSRPARRRIILGIAVVTVLALAVTLVPWARHQSEHVMSRNAVVRGQITEIGTRLDGVLVSIEVREGDQVKAGQILARLDDRHLQSEVSEAQAQIDGLQREIELEHSTVKHERLKRDTQIVESMAKSAAARSEVVAARSRADEAHDYRNVRQALVERQMISPEAMREAEAKYRTAQALVDVAWGNEAAARSAELNARIESDGVKLREQRIGVLMANVEAARARRARAQADIESAVIRAPTDGAVIRWLVKPGGSVETGKPVVSMSIGRDVRIEAWIDEDEIGLVKVGSPATVTLASHPGREFSGVVEAIGVTTDFEQAPADVPQPRFTRMRGAPMVGVVVRLLDAPETLMPGMTAVAAIRGEGR